MNKNRKGAALLSSRVYPIMEESKEDVKGIKGVKDHGTYTNEALSSNQLNQMEEFIGSVGNAEKPLVSPNNPQFNFNNPQGSVEDDIGEVMRDYEEIEAADA